MGGYMIEVYFFLKHDIEKVDREKYFSLSHNTRIWGLSNLKLSGNTARRNKRKYFFEQCIISLWHSMPCEDDCWA